MGRQKLVGTIHQHAAKLEGLQMKPKHPVTPANHLRPHVVKRVGEQRQGANVPGAIVRRTPADDVDQPLSLEPRRKHLRRPG